MAQRARPSSCLLLLGAGFGLLGVVFQLLGEPQAQGTPVQAVYDKDPNHLWNRVHAALLVRNGPDGKDYGHDRLEPLLWEESDYLLKGEPARRAVAVLEEFIRAKGETLIDDPLKKAILQRDLWHVADWLARAPDDSNQLDLLAKVIQRLALTPDRIAMLADNYAAAAAAMAFPDRFDPARPDRAYLPPDLFDPAGPWVCVGRTDGQTAPLHLQPFQLFMNSTICVFLKLPGGREATLAYLKALTRQKRPILIRELDGAGRTGAERPNPDVLPLPQGTELALVRRALLIDSQGRINASPLTESVQLRDIRNVPTTPPRTMDDLEISVRDQDQRAIFELQLRRTDLFAGRAGGLRDMTVEADFKTGFNAHRWDEFQERSSASAPFPRRALPFKNQRQSCVGCHRSPTIYGTSSFQRYSPPGEQVDEKSPPMFPVAALEIKAVEQAAIQWKGKQPSWLALRKLLPQ